MHVGCLLGAYLEYGECIFVCIGLDLMHITCMLDVHWLYIYCKEAVYWMYILSILDVCGCMGVFYIARIWMYIRFMLGVLGVY